MYLEWRLLQNSLALEEQCKLQTCQNSLIPTENLATLLEKNLRISRAIYSQKKIKSVLLRFNMAYTILYEIIGSSILFKWNCYHIMPSEICDSLPHLLFLLTNTVFFSGRNELAVIQLLQSRSETSSLLSLSVCSHRLSSESEWLLSSLLSL